MSAPSLSWTGELPEGRVWPDLMGPGSVVGLFAPAHGFDRGEMERGAAVLKSWGLAVRIPRGLSRRRQYLAGDDQHRLDIMRELMEDDQVAGLMAVRGGYGCQRLLPGLAELWAAWPAKPIFGFSDLTALHLARLKLAGVVGYHAPMAVSLGKTDRSVLADTISQKDLRETLLHDPRCGRWTFTSRDVLKPGRAKGPLWGGNLVLVNALLASPWLPSAEGAIVMLEEVDEPPYSVDRLLTTLKQSPVWTQAAALVFGRFSGCGSAAEVRRLLREATEDFSGPVVINAPFSHLSRNRLFPVGATAMLEV